MRSMAVGFKGTGRDSAVGLRERNVSGCVQAPDSFHTLGNTFKSSLMLKANITDGNPRFQVLQFN